MRYLLLLPVLILVSSCESLPHERQVEFVEADYAPYACEGDCSISGQAYVRSSKGVVKFGNGYVVTLRPATGHSSEWYLVHVVEGKRITDPDARADRYHRVTTAGSEGRFAFDNLPPGKYYLTCDIVWQVPTAYHGVHDTEGGIAHAVVTLRPAQHLEDVILTRD